MRTLDEAWGWYENTLRLLRVMRRLGELYWDNLPREGRLGRDQQLPFEGGELVRSAELGLGPLDDLAVLVLFSVFESLVRAHVHSEVKQECSSLRHVSLRKAADDTLQGILEGSFFRVLEPFKAFDPDLIEEVNQVRRYRNWVAHGRRGKKPAAVDPRAAFERLSRFLQHLEGRTEG